MIKVILTNANNGLVKKVINTNRGGFGESSEVLKVYENDTNNLNHVKKFLFDLTDDLGINLGNAYSNKTIDIVEKWGSEYVPSQSELDQKINELKNKINEIKEWKKTL